VAGLQSRLTPQQIQGQRISDSELVTANQWQRITGSELPAANYRQRITGSESPAANHRQQAGLLSSTQFAATWHLLWNVESPSPRIFSFASIYLE